MSTSATNPTSPSEGWRVFDGLDLESPNLKQNQNSLSGRLKGLDLADKRAELSVSVTATKMDEYTQRTAHDVIGPLFPAWASSMPKYSDHKITDSTANVMTCDSMEVKIQDVISEVRKGVDYNGLHVVNDFIKFCEEQRKIDPKMNSVEIFHRFQPNSRDEASLTYGSTCVGKAWDIVKRLKEIAVEAHVIIESAGPDDPPRHAAVAVPCKDGILLVEIEWDVPLVKLKPSEPFIDIPPENPDLKLSIEMIEVPGNYKTPTPLIVKKVNFTTETATQKNSYSQYVLRPDTDPDQSVMKRWLVSEHTWFYPVSSGKREGQEQHSIQVNVAPTEDHQQGKITFSIGNKKFRISLDAFDPTNRTIDRSKLDGDKKLKLSPEKLDEYKDIIFGKMEDGDLGGKFFDAFRTPKNLLMDQIFAIVANREMLKDLREK